MKAFADRVIEFNGNVEFRGNDGFHPMEHQGADSYGDFNGGMLVSGHGQERKVPASPIIFEYKPLVLRHDHCCPV